MDIVVLDGYTVNPGDLSWDSLSAFGKLKVFDRTSLIDEMEIIERTGDAEVVFTNKTPVSKKVIDACPGMRFISVLATGYNIVDYIYARERGIPVTNVPTYGTNSVSQFVIALLLEICHHIGYHNDAVHAGKWEKNSDWCFWDYPLIELADKTMGIIGFGKIGMRTGTLAKALGMRVLACDTLECDAGRAIAQYVSLEELLKASDVVALHCPLFPETEGIINAGTIAQMKDGVIILNNSRGQLVVEHDLANALNSGKVYAAAVDVVSSEPIHSSNPLLTAKNCIITPHISWAPKESRQRIINCAAENLRAYADGKPVNVVNL